MNERLQDKDSNGLLVSIEMSLAKWRLAMAGARAQRRCC
jgi:hypothetical protein